MKRIGICVSLAIAGCRRYCARMSRRFADCCLRSGIGIPRCLLASWKRPRPRTAARMLARGIAQQVAQGVLDIDDVGVAVHQLILLVITESLTRALYGMRKLATTEIRDIVGSGVDIGSCYSPQARLNGRMFDRMPSGSAALQRSYRPGDVNVEDGFADGVAVVPVLR